MLGLLVESKPRRTRRVAGTVISLLVHGGLIGGALFLTASDGPAASVPRPSVMPIEYIRVEDPEPSTRTGPRPIDRGDRPGDRALPEEPVFAPPIDIPTELPPIGAPHHEREISFGPSSTLGSGVLGPSRAGVAGTSGVLSSEAVDRVAMLVGGAVRPRYPERQRAAGVNGRVLVRFVVDTAGRVERGSVQTLAASHRDFETAVLDVLERLRFRPAEVGSRRVRMLVEMPFEFAIGDR